MSEPADTTLRSLEEIMGILANVTPGDQEHIMKAGARLEETIEVFEGKSTLLNGLIGQAWKALIHMYEKDEYFFSIRAAVLQAVNTIREFAINDGDIPVEVFEKASDDLEKALGGKAESLMEDTAAAHEAADHEATPEGDTAADHEAAPLADPKPAPDQNLAPEERSTEIPEVTLDDLASVIMQLTEDSLDASRLAQLTNLVDFLKDGADDGIATVIGQIYEKLAGLEGGSPDDPAAFLAFLSAKVEEAVQLEIHNDVITGPETKRSPDAPQPAGNENEGRGQAETPAVAETAGRVEDFRVPDDLDTALLLDFINECNEQIEEAESALLDLETSPDDDELINKVFRSFHTIKGTSAFMGLTPMSEFAHAVETLLDMVREDHIGYDSACADITLTSIDIIKSFLEESEHLQGGGLLAMPDDYSWMKDVLTRVSEYGKKPEEALDEVKGATTAPTDTTARDSTLADTVQTEPESGSVDSVRSTGDVGQSGEKTAASRTPAGDGAGAVSSRNPDGQKEQNDRDEENVQNRQAARSDQNGQKAAATGGSPPKRSDSEASVRVNVERLDRVIDMVGELVIAHSVVAQSALISADPDLSRKVSHSTKILRELQDTSLTLRMVPLKATFQKMNRLVRDLAKKSGKTVSYATEGEDTEIDRNMVDIINEPLVHLLRNALDHGIEDVQTREQKGKPGIAKIWLRAFQAGGKVIIEIEDDGKGLDKDKILAKAVSKGLVEANRKLTESEIYKLIFLPGFSTADKVSDLSGRGVGMDVVRKSIDQLQGKVDVSSKPDKGTKISLELPFTLAITDGMLVRIGSQQFIVPTINIDMTFRAKEEELFTILGDSEQVRFRGNAIPVIRLHRLFGVRDAIENIEEATLLVVNNNKKKYALLVDEVVGQQQLVGKSIDMPVKMRNISGGAILGDGRVGLILDTVALLN